MAGMILFNVGWMNHYRGVSAKDRLINGGQFVVQTGTGGEAINFLPRNGRYRGYVKLKGNTLKIEQLGGKKNAPYVENATIVFCATRPGGGRVVVGWYHKAKVFREYQPRKPHRYIAEARVEDCQLQEVDDRVFSIPPARKGSFGMGQSNIRYLDSPEAKGLVESLQHYMKNYGRPSSKTQKASTSKANVAMKKQVEETAVDYVEQYYIDRGFTCRSVEKDNVGWDLECKKLDLELLIEVKGCSGAAQVELTPNEYQAMKTKKHRNRYRLAVVSNALRDPVLSIVSYNISVGKWLDQRGRVASLTERTGARIRL